MAKIPEPPETVTVKEKVVSCDGGEGPLGHPNVYLNMGTGSRVECPYCDALYVLDGVTGKKAK
ncbi:MAG: zinc-finger domain-containing protein [Proteobacteria bacterium]|nr:zinc-finger domain-containing protein [Pseudomonadota bacterium]